MHITRSFLKPMREQGGGRIIQVSSVGGQTAFPVSSAYHASKWGLEGFTEGVSREVADFGVRFTLVEPGSTRTGFASLRGDGPLGVHFVAARRAADEFTGRGTASWPCESTKRPLMKR
jgi:NAD(P)-dependent dehydrogenase (short-subunit alcohol dehydrogenase family)